MKRIDYSASILYTNHTPPHEHNQIGIQLGSAGSTFPFVLPLVLTPHRFHVVGSSMSIRVYKVEAVVDCQMLVP